MQRGSEPPPEAEPAPRQQSSGLATALAALADDGSARVLDLGSASAASVAYFTNRVRELFIADLPRALRIEVPGTGPSNSELKGLVSVLLPSEQARFDLILAWDIIAHLGIGGAEILVPTLANLCRPGAHVLAFFPVGAECSLVPGEYTVVDCEHFIRRPMPGASYSTAHWVPASVTQLFAGFKIRSSVVLRQGLQEYLAVREG